MTRSSASTIYDDDFYAWTQEQATLMRELAAARSIPSRLDIERVAEEIEDLGKRDLREVRSFLLRLVEHLIKLNTFRHSSDVAHWRAEARHFQRSAFSAFSPSMRRSLDIARIWADGCKEAGAFLADVGLVHPSSISCPFTLDDLLGEDFDLDAALAKLAAPRPDGA